MAKIKKTVIILGYQCNNNCVFCVYQEKDRENLRTTDEIKKEIILAKAGGTTYLEFIGGETTIRPDLLEILNFAKKFNFETISITTNGRMLAYPEYAKKFLAAGVNSLVFSVHGHKAELHDHLTQVEGSFDQLMRGIENVKKLGFSNIGSNTTIVKDNFSFLPKIGKFIFEKLKITNSEFIFVDPNQGGVNVNFRALMPRISKAAPFIRKCLEIGRKNDCPHWDVRYVPLCYFEDYLDQISEIHERETFRTEHVAPDFVNRDVENSRAIIGRAKGEQCRRCVLNSQCEGIWNKYVEEFGDEELVPILKTR